MSISDDDLRAALRKYAETAGPTGFPAEPLIRRARRRRAMFAAAAAGCTLAVAAVAVAVAAGALAGVRGGPSQYVPPVPAGPARNGMWPTSFRCGETLPADLPGPAGYALRVSIGPIDRGASGQPRVIWYMSGTEGPEHEGPAFGKQQTIVLVVRDDGTIVAVQRAGLWSGSLNLPLVEHDVPLSDIARTEPRIVPCQPPSGWSRVWAHHEDYGVVVLTTAWVGYPGADPARFGAAAALPSG